MARIPCSDVKPMMMILNQEHLSCLYSGFKDFFFVKDTRIYLVLNLQQAAWKSEYVILEPGSFDRPSTSPVCE